MKTKRKIGRPKVADSTLRRNYFTIRLTDNDVALLGERAFTVGLSFSAFLRQAALSRDLPKPWPEINIKLFLELGRLGSNLNQILRSLHQGSLKYFELIELVLELTELIKDVRKEMTG